MNLTSLLAQRRLLLTFTLVATVLGIGVWYRMPRQEDPPVPNLRALIVAPYPGADTQMVEHLVLDPIEEKLAEVREIRHVNSQARAGVAVIVIELEEGASPEPAWDEVSRALTRAQAEFPEGAGAPELDRHYYDQESVVLAITGDFDLLKLRDAADRLKRALLSVPSVARVVEVANPGEQVTVEYDDEVAQRTGLAPAALAAVLRGRTLAAAGGSVRVANRGVVVRPEEAVHSATDLALSPITLPSGGVVPLSTLARIHHEPLAPASARMRVDGAPAVGLGIVPHAGIDRVRFGAAVRAKVAQFKDSILPLRIDEVAYQPYWVAQRLDDLGKNLLQGGIIVALLLVAFLSLRVGLIVSAVLPAVVFITVAVYAMGGGILHQVSVAALIISLGNAIDNAVVIAEDIQSRIDAGDLRRAAAAATVKQLAVPLASSTGTTMCAFLPMLLAKGAVADFTRAIPVVMIITLAASYAICLLVTPILCEVFLRARSSGDESFFLRLTKRAADGAMARPRQILALSILAVVGMGALAPMIPVRFFPASERNQLLVDIELPEGSALAATDGYVAKVEASVAANPNVVRVTSFIGRGAPRFYYNVPPQPNVPHVAQLLVETRERATIDSVLTDIRKRVRQWPEAMVVARRIQQGPPVRAPIELRLYGADLGDLERAADMVLREVRNTPGARDAHHTLGIGVPVVDFRVEEAAAGLGTFPRGDIAAALLGHTRGTSAGGLQSLSDMIPVVVRSSLGEEFPIDQIGSAVLSRPFQIGSPVQRLDQLARAELRWQPAGIAHRDRSRYVSVLAQVEENTMPSRVTRALEPKIAALQLPSGVSYDFGGDKANSGEANESLQTELPAALLLLFSLILLEFNSFRRMALVLLTIPLAIVGIVPALFLSGQPFSFFAMLGSLALVGIVVNNAILLIDFIENRRAEGASVEQAVRDAVHLRTRPVLLTAGVTIVGLLPMCFSDSDLWPPLAWAMLGGLVASTVLALFVVPIMYLLMFSERNQSAVPA